MRGAGINGQELEHPGGDGGGRLRSFLKGGRHSAES